MAASSITNEGIIAGQCDTKGFIRRPNGTTDLYSYQGMPKTAFSYVSYDPTTERFYIVGWVQSVDGRLHGLEGDSSTRAHDLPDHSRSRDLHQRSICFEYEPCPRVGLAEVPHRAIVDQVQSLVRAEYRSDWPVDAPQAADKRLLHRGVCAARRAVGAVALCLARAVECEAREADP